METIKTKQMLTTMKILSENSLAELEVNLKLNSKKMNLKKPQFKFMGHVISKNALANKIQISLSNEIHAEPTCKTLSLLGSSINICAQISTKAI